MKILYRNSSALTDHELEVKLSILPNLRPAFCFYAPSLS
jgi:hypothetical protein